ncbi:MAG: hypothetical protein FJX77_16590 [Armatimonadetes bacterium]|nr:hypothetical protein [Armatimonadota bacterium]
MSKSQRWKSSADPPSEWDTTRILPAGFTPMLATPSPSPLDSSDYGYEIRWDGIRVLCGLELTTTIISTGAAHDLIQWFPELRALREAADPDWVLLDGEVVVFEGDRPAPARLQERLRAGSPEEAADLSRAYPASLILSDILRIGDSWLLDVNWDERREILSRAVRQRAPIRISPVYREGRHALELARALGLDAVLAKRLKGRYLPGERTREWLAVKPLEVVSAVVTGWLPPRGGPEDRVGSVCLGMYRGEQLIHVGNTLAAIDAELEEQLRREFPSLIRPHCPYPELPAVTGEPRWLSPELVCSVRHHGWTAAGRLRSPALVALEPTRHPEDCREPGRTAARVRR